MLSLAGHTGLKVLGKLWLNPLKGLLTRKTPHGQVHQHLSVASSEKTNLIFKVQLSLLNLLHMKENPVGHISGV